MGLLVHEGPDGDGHSPCHMAKYLIRSLKVGPHATAGRRAGVGTRIEPMSPDELVLYSCLEQYIPAGCPERVAAAEEGDKSHWIQLQMNCNVEE